jgi:hypothetical protein
MPERNAMHTEFVTKSDAADQSTKILIQLSVNPACNHALHMICNSMEEHIDTKVGYALQRVQVKASCSPSRTTPPAATSLASRSSANLAAAHIALVAKTAIAKKDAVKAELKSKRAWENTYERKNKAGTIAHANMRSMNTNKIRITQAVRVCASMPIL